MIVVLYLLIALLCVIAKEQRDTFLKEVQARKDTNAKVQQLLQDIADQVDASTDLITASQDTFTTSLQAIDTKVHALAQVNGLILVNGLWQYETVISKPSTKKAVPRKGAKA